MSRTISLATPLVGPANSVNANINSLIAPVVWSGTALTYAFPVNAAQYTGYGLFDEPSRMTAAASPYKTAVAAAFRELSEFTNLTVQEVAPSRTAPPTMRFAVTADPDPVPGQPAQPDFAGWAYLPAEVPYAGDVWIKDNQSINDPYAAGDSRWLLIYHEIGHAIGMVHPFQTGGIGTAGFMDAQYDTNEYTLMAYRSSASFPNRGDVNSTEPGGGAQTWMQYDVAALQFAYGVNYTTRAGNTTYSWSPTTGQMFVDGVAYRDAPAINRILINVWDGGGTDTYDFSNYTTNAVVSLAPGGWSAPSTAQIANSNPEVNDPSGKAPGSISNSLLWNNDLRGIIENTRGGTGNDVIGGNQVSNTLWGGRGADNLSGQAGNDFLLGDGPVSLTANAQQIKRLYIATLDRGPDDGGWQNWVTEMGNGRPLTEIAGGFVGSAEFQTKYGNLSNIDFVKTLYRNVLDREADQGGLDANVNALNANQLTRTQIVVNFSESPEFITGTAPSAHTGQVYRLYGATLARAPDAGGFETWTDALGNGRGLVSVAAGFVNSTEFQIKYGTLTETQFVTELYRNVLSRAPDQGGLDYWIGQLAGIQSRTQVVTGFSESQEYINGTRAATDAFMRSVMSGWSDTLVGGQGDDRLTGGRGSDRYVFTASEGGNDVIYGFESFDTLELNGFGFANSAAALAAMSQQGGNVVLGYNGGSITFEATQLATLQSMTAQGWVLG